MRQAAGQAAAFCGRVLHLLANIAFAAFLLAAAGIGVLAWRLSQGPVDLRWLVHRLEAAVNADDGPTRLSIGSAALAWEGFNKGVDRPLDLRLTNIAVVDAKGTSRARIPRAEVSLSLGWMLLGRVVPRAIEVDGARLRAMRAQDGDVKLDLGSLDESAASGRNQTGDKAADQQAPGESWSALLAELSLPPQTDRGDRSSRWSQLRRISIRDAAVRVDDRQLGLVWRAPKVDIDLLRAATGGLTGHTTVALELGDQRATLTVQARLQGDGTSVQAQLSEIEPSAIAATSPALVSLSALDAPVTLSGQAELDANLAVKTVQATAHIGRGVVKIGAGVLPVEAAALEAHGTASTLDLTVSRLEMLGHDGATPTIAKATMQARRDGDAVLADLAIDLDQVEFADLAHLWPVGVGGKGTRPWITENITSGTATNLHVALGLRMGASIDDIEATSISGGLDGHDLTVHWLRPVPPLLHGEARLNFRDPDTIDILVKSGVQSGGTQGGVAIRAGKLTLTGLAANDQFADIDADLAGPIADVLAVLKNPRIKLLSRRPVEMRDPGGQMAGHLTITHLPLKNDVSEDDVLIHAAMHLSDVHLGGIAGGRDLDHGNVDLEASNDGLKLQGSAQLAKIPAQLNVAMDFRSGPPSQVLQKIAVTGNVTAQQLAANGVDLAGLMTGAAAVTANMQTRRDGRGELGVKADLGNAGLTLAPLAWTKPVGTPAQAETHLLLDHDKLTSIDRLSLRGDGIDMLGRMDFADGKPSVARLDRLTLGTTTDVHGELRWPGSSGAGWVVKLAGPSLDISAQVKDAGKKPQQPKKPDDGNLPAGSVNVALDRVHTSQGGLLTGVVLRGESDGHSIRSARLSGHAGAANPFDLAITPSPGGRRLSGSVADTGALLRALAVTSDVEGGRLDLSGSYDDMRADSASGGLGNRLSGRAHIGAFRLRNAPMVAKVLQAMTLYGVVEAMQGPGLGVSEVIAPFSLTGDTLELTDARAFSASLGATAKGSVDVGDSNCDLQGTIVPAYFFNALPGKIPLIGKMFSPERGGGLFAATYAVHGDCGDPSVSVNPLATLAPGFLRGLFGMFGAK